MKSGLFAERVGLDAILHAGDFSTANTNVQFSPGDYRNVIRGVTNCYCEHGNTTRECCRFSVFVFDTEKGKLHELRLAGGDKPNPKYPERELRPNRPTVSTTAFDIG